MEKEKLMITEKVYSPINDMKNIKSRKNIGTSPIWNNCFKADEYKAVLANHGTMICYTIKFRGLVPIHVTNIQKIK